MKKILIALLLFAAAPVAYAACPDPMPADTICVTWQAPTQYTDGSPILEGDLAKYTVYYSQISGTFSPESSLEIPDPDVLDFTTPAEPLNIVSPGPQGGDVEIFVVMTATDQSDDESAFSNEVSKTVTFPDTRGDPTAPQVLDIIINVTTS